MRKASTSLILGSLLSAAVFNLPAQAGEVLDRVRENKTLTIASDADYPPQSFLNDQNEMDGFDIDVAREIAARLGAELKVVTPAWEIITAGGWGSRWDLSVGSMAPTVKRAEVLDFPAVYYYTPAVFAVHEDSAIAGYADLNGKVIGACGGCTTESYLKQDLLIAGADEIIDYRVTPGEIRSYETDTNIYDDLRLGDGRRLDATLTPLPTVRAAIENHYPLKVVADPVFYEPMAVAVDKGDPEFSARIGEIVDELRTDGTLSRLSTKWYGYDYATRR